MSQVKVDKNKFLRYEKVRKSGVTNMWAVDTVCQLARLTKKEAMDIMKNYRAYANQWLQEEK